MNSSDQIQTFVNSLIKSIKDGTKTVDDVHNLIKELSIPNIIQILKDVPQDITDLANLIIDLLQDVHNWLPSGKTPNRPYYENNESWEQNILNPINFHLIFSHQGNLILKNMGWVQTNDEYVWSKQIKNKNIYILITNNILTFNKEIMVNTIKTIISTENISSLKIMPLFKIR